MATRRRAVRRSKSAQTKTTKRSARKRVVRRVAKRTVIRKRAPSRTTRKKVIRKVSRRKPVRRAATRKVARRPVKRRAAPKRRVVRRTTRKTASRAPTRKAPSSAKATKTTTNAPSRIVIGQVSHFFDRISVAVIDIKSKLNVGDKISFEGPQTNFVQPVNSMQIEHSPIKTAKPGDDVGMKVNQPVRVKDLVYKA